MSKSLTGRVALVTGGGRGVGRGISMALAADGATVAVNYRRDVEAADETVAAIVAAGGKAQAYSASVDDYEQNAEMVAAIEADHGAVGILVNNAGIAHIGNVEQTSVEDLDRIYNVNVKGVYHCIHSIIGGMVKNGRGVILNMASIASTLGIQDRFAYSMSKGAVMTMTLSVARDYVDKGVRCNCICPARVHTPFVDGYLRENYPGEEAAMFEKLSQYQPIGRMAKPAEIAGLATYLCSDEAGFVTGSAYDIDGGCTLLR